MKVTEYIVGNAIVIVSRPILTEKEQQKSENKILNALQQYGKAITETNLNLKGTAK